MQRRRTVHGEAVEGDDATRGVGHEGVGRRGVAARHRQGRRGAAVLEVAQHLGVAEEAKQHLRESQGGPQGDD